MNAILVKYLKDFSAPEPASPIDDRDFFSSGQDFGFPAIEDRAEPAIDIEAMCEAARQEGFDSAAQEFGARHETEIATLMAVHAGEMDDLRARFEKDIVRMVDERFASLSEGLAADLATEVAELLLPIVEDQIVRKTVEDLARTVRAALAEEGVSDVVVKGPLRLYSALREKLAGQGVVCRHQQDDGIDIAVEIDRSVVVSRLSAWKEGLSEVLA